MTNRLRAAALSSLVFAAAGCATDGLSAPPLPNQFSITGRDGAQIDKVAERAATAAGTNAALNAGAETLGRSQSYLYETRYLSARLRSFLYDELLVTWPHPVPDDIAVLVKVSAQDNYNASAHPDNTIVLNLSVLENISSDDQLAYLLAHEFAHIALGHGRRISSQIEANRMTSMLSSAYLITSALSQAEFDTQDGADGATTIVYNAPSDSEVAQSRKQAQDGLQTLRYINDVVRSPGWSRAQEDEADAIAADILHRAGFSVADGGAEFFESFGAGIDWRARAQSQALASVSSSLQSSFSAESILTSMGEESNLLSSAMDNMKKDLASTGRRWLSDYLSQTHRAPRARQAGIERYLENAYGSAATSQSVGMREDLALELFDEAPSRRDSPACDLIYVVEARNVVYAARGWDIEAGEIAAAEEGEDNFGDAVGQTAAGVFTGLADRFNAGSSTAAPAAPTPAQIEAVAAQQRAELEAKEAERAAAYELLTTYMKTGTADGVEMPEREGAGCPSLRNPVSRSAFYQAALAQFAPTNEKKLEHLTNAVDGDYPEAATFADKAGLEVALNRLSDADATISLGEAVYGDANFFLPEKMKLAKSRFNMTEVASLYTTCRGTERQELESRCRSVF
ncbi:MAG: M48 family metalloprotease, partial [Caulobacterales bacterium]|nr:M48 family metalloprotease [Caulobacterales bacterium]